jgi:translocator protein
MEQNISKGYYYGSLVGWICILQVIAVLIGFNTRGSMRVWYKNLKISPLTPPSFLIPITWTVLYVLIAIAGWRLQFASKVKGINFIRMLYAAQMILNWSWSPVFFIYHRLDMSFWIIIAMDCFVLGVIYLSWKNIR